MEPSHPCKAMLRVSHCDTSLRDSQKFPIPHCRSVLSLSHCETAETNTSTFNHLISVGLFCRESTLKLTNYNPSKLGSNFRSVINVVIYVSYRLEPRKIALALKLCFRKHSHRDSRSELGRERTQASRFFLGISDRNIRKKTTLIIMIILFTVTSLRPAA